MKILMISDVYHPRVNGVSTSIKTFRDTLAVQGIRVDLIVPDYGTPSADDAGIIRVPAQRLIFDPEDRLFLPRSVRQLTRHLRPGDYDLIHIQTPFSAHYAGLELARRLGCPVVESYHTFFEEYLFHYIPFLPKALLRWVARHFSRTQCKQLDHVLVPSTAMRDVLRAYGITVPITVQPTGIPLARFADGDGAAFRRRYDIPAQRPVLLFVGRVAFEKNIGFLLDMLPKVRESHPDILLLIAGEGPARKALEQQARRLGLSGNVCLLGYFASPQQLRDAYYAANIFVFASHTETQGLVLLEAMACGTPVVAQAVLGTQDILKPEQGALIAPDDANAFAAQVSRLLQAPELHAKLSSEARHYAQNWTAEALASGLAAFYQTLAAKSLS